MPPSHAMSGWSAALFERVDARRVRRIARAMHACALALCVLSVGALAFVVLMPLPPLPVPTQLPSAAREARTTESNDAEILMGKLAARPLMGAASAKSGVPESGALVQVLATLRLTGISADGAQGVAYVLMPSGQLSSVRVGDRLLQFHVDAIDKNKVHLSADGARYVLEYK